MNRTNRSFCIDLLSAILTATALLMPVAALAQSPAPASPLPPPGQGIPLAEIAARAEHIKQPLREITRRLAANAGEASLVEQIQALEERINAQSRQLDERLAAMTTLYELRELDRDWKARSLEIGSWQKTLTQRLALTESDLRWLREEQSRWAATLEQVTDTGLLEAVFDRIKSALAELQQLQTLAQERLNHLLSLQDRVSQLDSLVSARLDDLASAKQGFQGTLLTRDSSPLWSAFSVKPAGGTIREPVDLRGKSFIHELAVARESLKGQRRSFILLLVLFVALLLLNISLAKRIDPLTDGNPELRQSAEILKRPVSSALLITLLAQLWLSPLSASVINSVVALVLLIPFLLVVRSLFEPLAKDRKWMRIPFFALAILYLSDQVRFLADIEPVIERLIFLAETVVAIAVIVWMLRPKRFESLPAQPLTRKWLRRALFVMMGLIAVSLLANVLGLVTLAKVLGEGALHSAYLGGLMYGAARVVSVGGALLLRTNRAQISVFVQVHRDQIVKWCSRAIYFAAGLLWLFGSLELFTIREQFFTALGRVLDASLGFRSLKVSIGDIASFLLVAALAYYLAKIVRIVLQEDVLTRMPLERGVPQAMATAAQYLLLFVGFVLAVTAAGFDLNKLTLLTGAFGVGIGFGLQNIVNNFVSGLILLFERPVQIGDAVQVGSVSGDITRIGIRSSTIHTSQGAEVIVPNAKLISDDVTNWTLSNNIRRVELPVGVAYGSEPSQVIELLVTAAKSNTEVLTEPEPYVLCTGFSDSTLQFELRFWATNHVHHVIRSQVALAVADALVKARIEIHFPPRELRVKLDDGKVGNMMSGQGN